MEPTILMVEIGDAPAGAVDADVVKSAVEALVKGAREVGYKGSLPLPKGHALAWTQDFEVDGFHVRYTHGFDTYRREYVARVHMEVAADLGEPHHGHD